MEALTYTHLWGTDWFKINTEGNVNKCVLKRLRKLKVILKMKKKKKGLAAFINTDPAAERGLGV